MIARPGDLAPTGVAGGSVARGDSVGSGPAGIGDGRTALGLLSCWLLITAAWWTLALASIAEPPPWLSAARAVCFGSTASGLPDTYGWILLVAAPGSMLIAILVTWHQELVRSMAFLRARPSGRVLIAAVALFMVAGLSGAGVRVANGLALENINYDPSNLGALPEHYPRLGGVVPAMMLVDQDARPFTKESLRGRVTVMTFAFAHCHTVCPAIVQTVRSLAASMGENAPDVAVVTLDPWRDTPSRLPQMHADWQMPDRVRVLSGEVGDVTGVLDGFNVPWERDEATGDVQHPALVYAIDDQARIAYAFNNPSVEWLQEAVTRLREDGASSVP